MQINEALASTEEKWPAARDHLVCLAPDVLALLDSRPVAESERSRVLEVISLSLLHKMSYETFRTRYRALNTIVAPEIERRRRWTPIFTSMDALHTGSSVDGCAGDHCRRDALGTAEKVFEKLPGLSIPVLKDLTRHPKPAVRLYAMIRMRDLRSSLAAMETSELLRNDTAEVWVARDDLEHRAFRINSYTAMTSQRALLYSQWNSASVRNEDATEESATEQSMIAALGRAVALQACNWSETERVVAVDGWGQAIRVMGTPGGVVMWSHGANRTAGDGDDIVRHLQDCRKFQPGEPFRWTAAGGGVTTLPAVIRPKCN